MDQYPNIVEPRAGVAWAELDAALRARRLEQNSLDAAGRSPILGAVGNSLCQ